MVEFCDPQTAIAVRVCKNTLQLSSKYTLKAADFLKINYNIKVKRILVKQQEKVIHHKNVCILFNKQRQSPKSVLWKGGM